MLVAIFWAALFLVVYTYLIYPVLLWLLAAGRKMPEYAPLSEWPGVSLIIAAHNEEGVLRAKLENALAMDYPAERLDIVVVSDASTDGTDRIAAEFAARGVRLHRQEVRSGKTEAQNAGMRLARGQFVAFSDANSMYAPSALKRLLAPFADERIGCVCGELQYANPEDQGAGKGEGLYWRYEQFLKRRESLLSSALGANGAIYALRRELFVELRGDIISDFVAPLHAWRRGFRIAYEPTAVATEYSSGRFGDEFRRRRRIVSRSLYGLWTEAGVLNPFAHFFLRFRCFPTSCSAGSCRCGCWWCSRSISRWPRASTTASCSRCKWLSTAWPLWASCCRNGSGAVGSSTCRPISPLPIGVLCWDC